ncbi:hypothetical protein H4217_008183 [Coemansia sp. RSA 1939]|nr:hypothetical protein H4217_008183 [Coemansia sp. RSA 1939]KAJ2590539.1 hypothetical protein EV177_009050 [Coemansia sp. RSA 1804]KAJ2665919.1 hypothetical protein GGH99_006803 [Coemansia sp. RSA 1285]
MPYRKDSSFSDANLTEAPPSSAASAYWPRRRNPLPSGFLHTPTTPPRRRRADDNNNKDSDTQIVAEKSAAPTPMAAEPEASDASWDGDTIAIQALGPTVSRSLSSLTSSTAGPPDDPRQLLTSDNRQLKRAVSDLTRQLESRDDDVGALTARIEELRTQTEESRRLILAERQEGKRSELQIRWHEDQLRQQQVKIDSMAAAHRLALQLARRKHDSLVERLAAKIVGAENDARRLRLRVAEVTGELDGAREREREARAAAAALGRQFSDARRVACQAAGAAVVLVERLAERARLIRGLEHQLRRLRPPSSAPLAPDADASAHAVGPPPSPCLPLRADDEGAAADVAGCCLHDEITKATLAQQEPIDSSGSSSSGTNAEGRLPAPPVAAPPANAAPADGGVASESIAYWLAVYVHMLWAFYYRICISPVLCVAAIVVRAVFLFAAPAPLARALSALGGAKH